MSSFVTLGNPEKSEWSQFRLIRCECSLFGALGHFSDFVRVTAEKSNLSLPNPDISYAKCRNFRFFVRFMKRKMSTVINWHFDKGSDPGTGLPQCFLRLGARKVHAVFSFFFFFTVKSRSSMFRTINFAVVLGVFKAKGILINLFFK